MMIPELVLGMAYLSVFTAVGFKLGMGALVLTRIPMTQRDQQRNDHVPEPHRQH